jgi:hypothetical protein
VNHSELLDEILRVPWVLNEYQSWLNGAPVSPSDDYLFYQSRTRFAPNDDDRLILLEAATIEDLRGEVGIRVSEHLDPIRVPSIPRFQVESLLTALSEQPLLVELPLRSHVPAGVCDQFLRIGFGQFVFAPSALENLEKRACAAEIVRFPASPYEITRNYWTNVGHLSSNVPNEPSAWADISSFVYWLRVLHVQLLLGAQFDTFYRPSSPIAQKRVEPGALYARITRTVNSEFGIFILDGPRVNAPAVGGSNYHRLVCESLGIGELIVDDYKYYDKSEYWGRLIKGRARSDEQAGDWFLPARPLEAAHWELLWGAWSSAMNAVSEHEPSNCVEQLGRFHWYFVHLHPFACANQSLAFALINCLLNRVVGSGIPQLVLDQLALRVNCEEYTRLFGRAVASWCTCETGPLTRHKDRMQKRQVLERFLTRLDESKTRTGLTSVLRENPQGARLALLLDD